MCDSEGPPVGLSDALALLDRALDHLNAADSASLPASVQAEALRALGRAEAKHTAARARLLGAFAVQRGFEDDGRVRLRRCRIGLRFGGKQGTRIRVLRRRENRLDRPAFDQPPLFHDGNLLSEAPHQIQVMGNQQHRHAALCGLLLLQFQQQVDDLRSVLRWLRSET